MELSGQLVYPVNRMLYPTCSNTLKLGPWSRVLHECAHRLNKSLTLIPIVGEVYPFPYPSLMHV